MGLHFVTSSKGKPLLVLDGYTFRKDYVARSKTRWRCMAKGCRACVVTEGDQHDGAPEHTHSPDPLKVEVRKKLNQLREQAEKAHPEVPTSVIVAGVLGNVASDAVRGELPSLRLLRRQVRHAQLKRGPVFAKQTTERRDPETPKALKAQSLLTSEAACSSVQVREMASSANEFSVSYVTAPNQECAEKLANGLVEGRLAACINIIPGVTSIYRWEGKVTKDSEVILMIKSPTSSLANLTDFVKVNHPYEVCEVISTPVQSGNPAYLQFLRDATTGNKH